MNFRRKFMRREKKSVMLSLVLSCCLFFTSEFGTLAADPQSEARAIETINHEVTISPLAEAMEQIPEVAEKAAKKAKKEKAAKEKAAKKRAAKKAKAKKAKKVSKSLEATKRGKTSATVDERTLLAALIYCEAGNQCREGKVAVGAVVINRMKSKKYPNTMRKVIYQRGQFGPAITGKLDRVLAQGKTPKACYEAADAALAGENPIGDALYFGCGNYGKKIQDHWFH